jgi:hypothetical protein
MFPRAREARRALRASFPRLRVPRRLLDAAFPGVDAVRGAGNATRAPLRMMRMTLRKAFPLGNTARSGGNEAFPVLRALFPRGNGARSPGNVPRRALRTFPGALHLLSWRGLTARSRTSTICTSEMFVQSLLDVPERTVEKAGAAGNERALPVNEASRPRSEASSGGNGAGSLTSEVFYPGGRMRGRLPGPFRAHGILARLANGPTS